ncbi:splicing regulatory glutamine/lysine-rich protein 1 [Corythoichthys intestinalis]|uniref:splicing regulatory glutamine/lysine-rich protein 1 n=1 Tax=Corythoichthys intestinalis TaxID=161448 RepID=UPI0025A500D8|nr:splicing regulatory glutamine/lysine-rich protein 1 [Corythoichthys intestinalis]XP_061800789.1 splicing regulatory glutamine/lysine-rich protein 1-like [Nerophis lumbriciformis]
MSGIPGTAVVQVTNLSSVVSSDQMRTLFGFLGDIEELRLYPPDNTTLSFSSKVCYIKFKEPSSVGVAQHLTNTVFIDRALIVVPCAEGKIPEEAKALSLLAPAPPVHSLLPGGGLLPIPTPIPLQNLNLPLMGHVTTSALDPAPSSVSQPPLMGNVDPTKVDEIRRTVYVGNLNSQTATAEQLMEFFRQVGDVKFVRMAGDETQPTRFAFVEFVEQDAVARALTFNGVMFGDRPLKVNHSNNAIVKPPEMTAQQLESVMKRVREAQSTIAAAIEPAEKEKRYAGHSGRSRRQSRSRSRSGSRKKSSRSKHGPTQKWPRNDVRTSRRGHGRRSRSRERRRSTSRSRIRRRSRGRSRSPPRKARSPSPKRIKKRRERSREARERSSSKNRSRKDEERPRGKMHKVGRDDDRDDSPSEDTSSPLYTQHNGVHNARSDDSSI